MWTHLIYNRSLECFSVDLKQRSHTHSLALQNNITPSICLVHYWQRIEIAEALTFNKLTITFQFFLQWVKANFYRHCLIPWDGTPVVIKVYYVPAIHSWDQRIQIEDTAALRLHLSEVTSSAYTTSLIAISFERGSSPDAPPDEDESSCSCSCSDASSWISELTQESEPALEYFQRVVTIRDGHACVLCGLSDIAQLRVLQLIDESVTQDAIDGVNILINQFDLLNEYEPSNGLTFCENCYEMFDTRLCCVSVEVDDADVAIAYKIVVSPALKTHSEFGTKWTSLDGANVRTPSLNHSKYWPPVKLFRYFESQYLESMANTVK